MGYLHSRQDEAMHEMHDPSGIADEAPYKQEEPLQALQLSLSSTAIYHHLQCPTST